MSNIDLQRKSLPFEPGIYQFKDKEGTIIYIGKAINLRKRVSQYFIKTKYNDPYYEEKIKELVKNINSIEYIVTENEKEALILENILIKKHHPQFNVVMRDSKTYPWVMITYSENFPRIRIIRNPHHYNQNNLFLGPYTDKREIQRILRDLRKIFPYCSCKKKVKKKERHCLYFQLKLCPGPCKEIINEKDYVENIKRIELFLKGKTSDLKKQIEKNMEKAAMEQNYEIAAFWRDKLDAIVNSTTKQHVLLNEILSKDIIQNFSKDGFVSLVIIHIREGKIVNKSEFTLDLREKVVQENEILISLLEQYYQDKMQNIPDIIIISTLTERFELLNEILKSKQENIQIRTPMESNEHALMNIAYKNAKVMVEQQIQMEDLRMKDSNQDIFVLEKIQNILDLPEPPKIIEGFDISNIEGKDATGSMVFFLDGKPYNKNYRYYKIKTKSTPDDVGMMKEVIRRRYSSILKKNGNFPDLILVDGGKGQLNATVSVLEDLGLEIPTISLAKRLEEIFIPNKKEPIILSDKSPVLQLFQRIRDEAHRFSIKLHKKQREKKISTSILDDIKGIGPITRNKLLKYFGSVEEIKNATFKEISQIVGEKLAGSIKNYLKNNK